MAGARGTGKGERRKAKAVVPRTPRSESQVDGHKCSRWWRRQQACPFAGKEAHREEDSIDSERFYAQGSARDAVHALIKTSVAKPGVGVREPHGGRVPSLADAIALPVPAPPPPAVGVPVPRIPSPRPGIPLDIPREVGVRIGMIPKLWEPSLPDALQIERELATVPEFRVAKGFASPGLMMAMAEEATARVFEREGGNESKFPYWLFGIPFIREAMELVLKTRPGVLGRPGPMDPPAKQKGPGGSVRPGKLAPAFHPQTGGRGVSGPKVGVPSAGGGRHINYSAIMDQMTARPTKRLTTPLEGAKGAAILKSRIQQ